MNTLIGYGTKFKSMEIFKPLPIFDLFSFSYEEITKEELSQMTEEDLWDILTYSEEITLEKLLQKVANKSSLVEYAFTGVLHSIIYSPKMSWDVSQEHKNIQPSDVHDEINYLLEDILKEGITLSFQKIFIDEL